MTFGALSGFTVGVTADRRADEQVELLERRGATTVHAPVIRTLPLSEEDGLRAATEELLAAPPDLLVVCTALGMRSWCSAMESLGLLDELLLALRHTHVMVRGPKAAGAAHAAGVDVGWTAEEATYDEVVHRLTAQSSHAGDGRRLRLGVVLDGAGSEPVVDAAGAHGFEVIGVPVYRWDLPADTGPAQRLVTAVAERTVDAATFTSAHAVGNFFALAEESGVAGEVLEAFNLGVVTATAVGPVTGARLRGFGVRFGVEPRNPRLGAMVQALAASFTGRGRSMQLSGHPVTIQGRLVAVDGEELASLTDRERAVLQVLADRRGAVVSKRALMAAVWGNVGDEHVVEVTVARLRRRLGRAGHSIETVVRRGYRLTIDDPVGDDEAAGEPRFGPAPATLPGR